MKSTAIRPSSVVKRGLLGAFLALVVAASFAPFAFAGSFSYEGYGIRGKASVASGYISSDRNATVYHNQTQNYPPNTGMRVSVQKQEWFGWPTVNSQTFYGTTSGSFGTWCQAGTYRLYFESTDGAYTFNIWGSFNW